MKKVKEEFKEEKIPKDLKSEAALAFCLKHWNLIYVEWQKDGVILLSFDATGKIVAILSLKDIISKRKSLKGVRARLMGALRGSKKKSVKGRVGKKRLKL